MQICKNYSILGVKKKKINFCYVHDNILFISTKNKSN